MTWLGLFLILGCPLAAGVFTAALIVTAAAAEHRRNRDD